MVQKIINIKQDDNYRVVAISDVHGHYNLLEELIKQVKLREKDYLIIVGDFINKGVDSYKTYEYVKELSKRENTFVLKGNHEVSLERMMATFDKFEKTFSLIQSERYETLISSILKSKGMTVKNFKEPLMMYEFLMAYYKEVFEFIESLPIVLNIDEFRFVHGGYDEKLCPINDEAKFLKYDNYNELSQVNDKVTVVGHWPASNLRYDEIDNRPYYNDDKNIIFIDGGLGVKQSGELNAFVIEKENGKINYQLVQHNSFKERRVRKYNYFEKEDLIYVNYPHYDIEILENGEFMTKCRHVHSQKEFSVFNSLLVKNEDKYDLKITYVNNFLNLKPNEKVKVCLAFEDCVLVKYQDEFGWLLKEQLDMV